MQDRLEQEGLNLSKEETEGEDRTYICKSCCPPLEDGPAHTRTFFKSF